MPRSPIQAHPVFTASTARIHQRDSRFLSVELEAQSVLPPDDSVEGFDNIASALTVSPVLMERYLLTARRVSRLAVGDPSIGPGSQTKRYSLSARQFQDYRASEGSAVRLARRPGGPASVSAGWRLPNQNRPSATALRFHSRPGRSSRHRRPHRRQACSHVHRWRRGPRNARAISHGGDYGVAKGTSEQWETYRLKTGDAQLKVVIPVEAGTRTVGVSFVTRNYELEGVVQPGPTGFHFSVDESLSSAAGRESRASTASRFRAYKVRGAGETPSRKRLFVCQPRPAAEELPCATTILSRSRAAHTAGPSPTATSRRF